jgi:hypothetical protein
MSSRLFVSTRAMPFILHRYKFRYKSRSQKIFLKDRNVDLAASRVYSIRVRKIRVGVIS